MEKLIQNPGVNVLELGKTHFYLNSHFNFYQYNLSSINREYNKIINHKDEILNHISKHKNFAAELETYKNILKFNCEQLTDKIKIITSHRSKRGIINGLGTIVKTLTGNLDANDGRRYDELFEKINKNMYTLQTQNLDMVKLNKEMISKFNNQLNNIKHNEEILSTQIIEIKTEMESNYNWRMTITVKDALNQLILLAINLKEIISEIETSISFCGMNKIHSSIIDMETLRKIVGQSTKLDFLEISKLVKSHCRLKNNIIEYLIEIPVYTAEENVLYQITPIPVFMQNKLYILNENEELIAKRKDEFITVENCIRNKNKYFCNINRYKTRNCIVNIIKAQNNKDCKYHKINNLMFLLKIRNSDIAIIASDKNETANLFCDDYVKTKIIMGVFKIKTNRNCSLNNQTLEITKYYNKEIIFENVNIKFEENQLTNKTLKLHQISEQEIFVKELHAIDDVRKEKSHIVMYTLLIIIIVVITLIVCKKWIFITINRVKRQLALGELRNQEPATSARISNTQFESAVQLKS